MPILSKISGIARELNIQKSWLKPLVTLRNPAKESPIIPLPWLPSCSHTTASIHYWPWQEPEEETRTIRICQSLNSKLRKGTLLKTTWKHKKVGGEEKRNYLAETMYKRRNRGRRFRTFETTKVTDNYYQKLMAKLTDKRFLRDPLIFIKNDEYTTLDKNVPKVFDKESIIERFRDKIVENALEASRIESFRKIPPIPEIERVPAEEDLFKVETPVSYNYTAKRPIGQKEDSGAALTKNTNTSEIQKAKEMGSEIKTSVGTNTGTQNDLRADPKTTNDAVMKEKIAEYVNNLLNELKDKHVVRGKSKKTLSLPPPKNYVKIGEIENREREIKASNESLYNDANPFNPVKMRLRLSKYIHKSYGQSKNQEDNDEILINSNIAPSDSRKMSKIFRPRSPNSLTSRKHSTSTTSDSFCDNEKRGLEVTKFLDRLSKDRRIKKESNYDGTLVYSKRKVNGNSGKSTSSLNDGQFIEIGGLDPNGPAHAGICADVAQAVFRTRQATVEEQNVQINEDLVERSRPYVPLGEKEEHAHSICNAIDGLGESGVWTVIQKRRIRSKNQIVPLEQLCHSIGEDLRVTKNNTCAEIKSNANVLPIEKIHEPIIIERKIERAKEGQQKVQETLKVTERVSDIIKNNTAEKINEVERVTALEKNKEMEKAKALERTKEIEKAKALERTKEIEKAKALEKTNEMEKAKALEKINEIEKAKALEKTKEIEKAKALEKINEVEKAKALERAKAQERAKELEISLQKVKEVEKANILAGTIPNKPVEISKVDNIKWEDKLKACKKTEEPDTANMQGSKKDSEKDKEIDKSKEPGKSKEEDKAKACETIKEPLKSEGVKTEKIIDPIKQAEKEKADLKIFKIDSLSGKEICKGNSNGNPNEDGKKYDVPGLSEKVLKVAESGLPKGVSKGNHYKNPEYYSYHKDSFSEAHVELNDFRLPQPSAKQQITNNCKPDDPKRQ